MNSDARNGNQMVSNLVSIVLVVFYFSRKSFSVLFFAQSQFWIADNRLQTI